MDFTIKSDSSWNKTKSDSLVIPIDNLKNLPPILDEIDQSLNGQIQQLKKLNKLNISANAATVLFCPENSQFKQVILIGCSDKPSRKDLISFFKASFKHLEQTHCSSCTIFIHNFSLVFEETDIIQIASKTIESQRYQYDTTLSKKAPKINLKKVAFVCKQNTQKHKRALSMGKSMALGIERAKQLGNLPGNICTPSYLAKQAEQIAKQYTPLKTQILNETQLKKLKMGALLSVTAGTDEPAKVIIMEYNGGKKSDKPTVLIGKGVTFDSGGISLKPGAKMDEMKFDMCGAASVLGTIEAAALLKLKTNIVAIIGAVENMPSGKATKPGDVVTSMSGQTIEVLNTDAEGRLVLCDLLTYAERYKPKAVIDIATLTGACVVALGHHASGLYANNDALSDKLKDAGEIAQDRAWPMPLWDEYNEQLNSKFADMGNIGGPGGGSVTAACFLSRFTKKYPWAHLDIAGTAWQNKMASGSPVGLLTQYLIDHG